MNVVLTGSVAYDYLMYFPGQFRDHILPDKLDIISLSFHVESMVRLRGGNASNIAYTLAILGEKPRLFATVGEDFEEYRQWLNTAGVDTTWAQVIPGVFTATFFANTDRTNAQIASFYPGAMAYAASLSLKNLADDLPDLVVISPNDPEAMKRYVEECQELGLNYFYDPSQQIVRLEMPDLRKGIEGAQALFVNEYEFALIQKATGMSKADILRWVKFLVVTLGERGALVSCGSVDYHIPCVPPEKIADPTGVGDAFRGGFIKAYGFGMDWETCGQVGVLAATYCLENHGPQGHSYTPKEFIDRFRRHFDDRSQLDRLLYLPP
ncbi:MAG TPA: carbohydrate kinase family protein [Anaerolineales bacterium]|nr:carbohydrate kinase family protein [Anaerolineales bacterium]